MGVTNLSKAKLGIPVLGKASKTVLESSLHYSKIYGYKKINLLGGLIKKLPYFTGVKAGMTRNWASFYGRNAVWFGAGRFSIGGGLIYNNINK
ncbi:hypothetical protein [Chryseobacterium proteolyticum]|uniref:hypothetical protein n=1 Tax=Chryseobacterium proteolyticum TaxID=118127 RepID=UPI0039838369